MKTNLLLYLSAGFNIGALSTVIIRNLRKNAAESGKDVSTLLLSGLAAASAIGFVMSNKPEQEEEEDSILDVHQNPTRQLETFLV